MNRKPHTQFDPSSSRARIACAVVAIVATLATLAFVEALAHGYGRVLAQNMPVVIAQR